MRGKHIANAELYNPSGITPADAGKTGIERRFNRFQWDHPRGCGENLTVCRIITFRPGSPPRMRGKQSYIPYRFLGHGITPADAGKTEPSSRLIRLNGDHPRGCGENSSSKTSCRLRAGSPPRMRGKLRGHLAAVKQNRITPADAGKTAIKTF